MWGGGREDYIMQGGGKGLRDIAEGNEAGPYRDPGIEYFNRGNSWPIKKKEKEENRQGGKETE